ADAVDGDRALVNDVAKKLGRHGDTQIGGGGDDRAHRVDMTLHEVAAEPVGQANRALQVHPTPGVEGTESRAHVGLLDHVGLPPVFVPSDDGETRPVDRYRRTHLDV